MKGEQYALAVCSQSRQLDLGSHQINDHFQMRHWFLAHLTAILGLNGGNWMKNEWEHNHDGYGVDESLPDLTSPPPRPARISAAWCSPCSTWCGPRCSWSAGRGGRRSWPTGGAPWTPRPSPWRSPGRSSGWGRSLYPPPGACTSCHWQWIEMWVVEGRICYISAFKRLDLCYILNFLVYEHNPKCIQPLLISGKIQTF